MGTAEPSELDKVSALDSAWDAAESSASVARIVGRSQTGQYKSTNKDTRVGVSLPVIRDATMPVPHFSQTAE